MKILMTLFTGIMLMGCAGADHRQRVAGFTDALVGRHRHINAATQLRELVDRGARLLEVLQRAQGGRPTITA